jgi:hypothetical protein
MTAPNMPRQISCGFALDPGANRIEAATFPQN